MPNLLPYKTPYICTPIAWDNLGCPTQCTGFLKEWGDGATGSGGTNFDYSVSMDSLEADVEHRWAFIYRECADQGAWHTLTLDGTTNFIAALDDCFAEITVELHNYGHYREEHCWLESASDLPIALDIPNALNPCGGMVIVRWTGVPKPAPGTTGWKLTSYSSGHNTTACLGADEHFAPKIGQIFPRVHQDDTADYFTTNSNIFFYLIEGQACTAVPRGMVPAKDWDGFSLTDNGGTMTLKLEYEDAENYPPPLDFEIILEFEEIV